MANEIEVGKTYKTYGGWGAIVIWRNMPCKDERESFIVVHKPRTEKESFALCDEDGVANALFSINEPPTYAKHHPADLRLN